MDPVDENNVLLEVVGWCRRKRPAFLVRYSRPSVCDHTTYALVGTRFLPAALVESYEATEDYNLDNLQNRGAIKLENIIRVLDMAWYSGEEPACADNHIKVEFSYYIFALLWKRKQFLDVFLLLEWKSDDGQLQITWEYAETLMDLMEPRFCMNLLSRWVSEVDWRHRQMVFQLELGDVRNVLGAKGWQYM
ncbi:uncharacterized protein BDR25DRAFT_386549 [Lindgomyces ingoldianus]|uniref:Uncharacterized protein n=1 Tax=Lindgomyces ingoldianus TaxID=673940 RepID=A0ACB6R597_9PLEO|nr:uncharacterized protein BDR25DRAFT_386549 [Lindgomyces ingoldianus]KAF2473697.1 hypothetical protein BDR25DRAFT_386549 [Lindgomyces ingoldianus]